MHIFGAALLFNEVNDEDGSNEVDPKNNNGGNTTEGNSNQTDNKLPSTGSDNTLLIVSVLMSLASGTVYVGRRFILNK